MKALVTACFMAVATLVLPAAIPTGAPDPVCQVIHEVAPADGLAHDLGACMPHNGA